MSDSTILILFTALLLIIIFVLPQIMLRSAVSSVIRTFRQSKAVGAQNARTIDELGLRPKSMMQAIFRGTQYKTTALIVLRNAGVIKSTEDKKLYLSEDNLSRSKWKGR
ncbi:MAG: hypothetical protein MUO89_03690 [Dehalococcoidia bacterium]|nr:hypothetical protein [Dehalococcoidia bacterium]